MTQTPKATPRSKALRQPFSRRSVLKAATGAAAGFYAFGVPGRSYQRARAQDDIRQQLLATSDPEEAGQIALRTTVEQGAFQGQTVRFQGLSNTNFHVNVFRPLSRAWEEHTGATVEWIEVTQADSYPRMFQAISSDTVNFDILEASGGWEGDLLGGGHCLPMPNSVRNDPGYDFDDIVPYLQEPTRTWDGQLYGASIDGDMHHFNFRKDVFADQDLGAEWASNGGEGEWGPPTTWQQVQAMSEFVSDKQFEGQPLYGQLDSFRVDNTSQYFFHSRASAYGKHPDDPAFLFDLDMTPRINSPAFVRALEEMVAGLEWAPPDQQNADLLQNLGNFLAGSGTMCHWWADVGSNVYTNDQSIVQGKVGYSILPGSPDVYNHGTGAWDTLPEPNAAPYLAFLGWGLYVMKVAETEGVVDASWDLISHLSGRDVSAWMSVYPSGMNPWRESHFDAAEWEVSGFPVAEAEEYLTSIRDSYNHPNRIVDLRIPGVGQYWGAAEAEWARAVSGDVSAQEALDAAAARWNEITDTLGRERQAELYRASLGL